MNVQLMNVTTTVLAFPSDGNGARTTTYPTPKLSTGSEVFTATGATATWGAGAGPSQTNAAVAGDYVTTSDGCWGVYVSGDATSLVVEKWRSVGQVNAGNVSVIPKAGSTINIYSGKCQLVGSRRPRIMRIIITKGTAADTLIITDAIGTTVYTYTVALTIAAGANAEVIDFTGSEEGGRRTDGPFGIKLSASTIACVVEYVP